MLSIEKKSYNMAGSLGLAAKKGGVVWPGLGYEKKVVMWLGRWHARYYTGATMRLSGFGI